ncbi:MAG TPA: cytochrome P450 [Baekduia sp.]|nr:cytochrome P450 [Baekduia sp.]
MTPIKPVLERWDPFSQAFITNPDPFIAEARERSPVFWYEPLECWFVTGYEDVQRVFTDSTTFSSRALRTVPLPDKFADRLPRAMMNTAFINTDAPQHSRDHKAVAKGLSRSRIAALEPCILEFATELIDSFVADGACDFMQRFAYPLSLRVIVEVLGLPEEDMPNLRQWTEDMFSIMSAGPADAVDAPTRPMEASEVEERYGRLADAWAYFEGVVEDRRARPTDDFVSLLANSRGDDGDWLMDDDTIKVHLLELVAAGNDTTSNLMGNMLLFFSEHPDQLQLARTDASLWDNAIEESLRRRSSGPHLLRITTDDVELSGVTIPKGSVVVVNTTGANTDPAHFDDPLQFDVRRGNAREHLTFGKGRHFCLGAPLARLEARICMREIYDRLRDLEVPAQELVYVPAMTVQTLTSLRITWTAEGAQQDGGPDVRGPEGRA